MVTLKNDLIEIQVSELGAELRKMTVGGKDVLWNGDPAVWSGVSPLLFPLCGGVKNDRYTLGGREYTIQKHGFARKSTFAVERRGENFVTFLLTDSEETLTQYPFRFELRVIYTLRGRALDVAYHVTNRSDETMYFSIGSHEAYACPDGIENYDIIFPRKETLCAWDLDGNLLAHSAQQLLCDGTVFPLYEKYFEVDALVFKDVKSHSATLRNRRTGRSVTVDFPDNDYLLLWQKHGAKYICIEPWSGIPAFVDAGDALEEKEGILSAAPGEEYRQHHTIYL